MTRMFAVHFGRISWKIDLQNRETKSITVKQDDVEYGIIVSTKLAVFE